MAPKFLPGVEPRSRTDREGPESAHPARCRSLRRGSLNRTYNGHSGPTAGTDLHAINSEILWRSWRFRTTPVARIALCCGAVSPPRNGLNVIGLERPQLQHLRF